MGSKEFWENIKVKYEEKNKNLNVREQDLRHKLDAMEAILAASNSGDPSCSCANSPQAPNAGFFNCVLSMFSLSSKSKEMPPNRAITPPQDSYPGTISPPSSSEARCDCEPCMYEQPTTDLAKPDSACDCLPTSDVKTPSINSMDIFYMKTIEELATQHKNHLNSISELEQKHNIFEKIFRECKGASFGQAGSCPCPRPPRAVMGTEGDDKSLAEMKLENFLLKNELKEMRLEIRQYIERMEGPMLFKIESERYKAKQLEDQLDKKLREVESLRSECEQQVTKMQAQLCNANTKLYDLSNSNKMLQEATRVAQQQAREAMQELVKQKMNESETLKKVQQAFAQSSGAVKTECSLHEIARELSRILNECDLCNDCKHMPQDLISAAQLLKSLTDLVDKKLKQTDSQSVPAPIAAEENIVDLNSPPEKDIKVTNLEIEDVPRAESLQLIPLPPSTLKKCPCVDELAAADAVQGSVQQLWPKDSPSEKLKLKQQIVTQKSKDVLKSHASLKCVQYNKEFPFNVDTTVDYIDKPPDGVHVTTTITNSGTLEVITEGPEGMIETTLVYTESGHVEVLTEMADNDGNRKTCNRGKFKPLAAASVKKDDEKPGTSNCPCP